MCFPVSQFAQLLFYPTSQNPPQNGSITIFGWDAPKCPAASFLQGCAALPVCLFVCLCFYKAKATKRKKSHLFLLCVFFFFFFLLRVVICCLARSATTAALCEKWFVYIRPAIWIHSESSCFLPQPKLPFNPTLCLRKCFHLRTFQNILQFSASTSDPQSWGCGAALPVELTATLSCRSVSRPVDALHCTAAQPKNPAVGIKVTYFRAKQIKIFIITPSRLCWNEGEDKNKTNSRKQNKPQQWQMILLPPESK